MKKNITWILISALFLMAFPWICVTLFKRVYILREIKDVILNPLYFVILGISIGRNIKKHWFLLIISLIFVSIGEVYISEIKWGMDWETLLIYLGIYIALAVIAMISAANIHNNIEGKPDYKNILKKSGITSGIIIGVCFFTNLVWYFFKKDIIFGITSWVSFEPFSLIISLEIIFVIAFIIFWIYEIYKIRFRKLEGKNMADPG